MSRKVRLPMRCAPADKRLSKVHSIAPPSIVGKIQSISSFGPPTKPSRDTDIFRISFLIASAKCGLLPLILSTSKARCFGHNLATSMNAVSIFVLLPSRIDEFRGFFVLVLVVVLVLDLVVWAINAVAGK